MIKLFQLLLLAILLNGCKGRRNPQNKHEIKPIQSHVQMLVNDAGRYPQQVNLFGHDWLAGRLQKLMGDEYVQMMDYWNVETPITIHDLVLICSGCKQHDCPAYHYYVLIDLENDNLNVFFFKGSQLTVFVEKDTIILPPAFEQEIQVVKRNAGVADSAIVFR